MSRVFVGDYDDACVYMVRVIKNYVCIIFVDLTLIHMHTSILLMMPRFLNTLSLLQENRTEHRE